MSVLAEVAPAAPLIGGAAWLLIGLGVLLTYLVLFGLKHGYDYSLGSLLTKLAQLTSHVWLVGGSIAHAIDAANHWVEDRLAQGLASSELVVAKWWHGMEWIVRTTGDVLEQFGADVHGAFDALVHGTVPTVVKGTTEPLKQALAKAERALSSQAATLEHDLTKRAKAIEGTMAADFGAAWRGIDHITGSVLGALAHTLTVAETDLANLRDYLGRTFGARLKAIEELLAGGLIAAIGLSIVSRLFPFLRCTNVQKAARSLCRFPTQLLESLLADALEAAVLLNICEAVSIMTRTAKAFEPELAAIVGVTDAALQCSHGDAPAHLNVRTTPLPAFHT